VANKDDPEVAFLGCVLMLCIMLLVALVSGLVLQFLWNATIPSLFNGPTLTYWQGVFGVVLLRFVGSFFGGLKK
jgi:uncharacterized membrane protein